MRQIWIAAGALMAGAAFAQAGGAHPSSPSASVGAPGFGFGISSGPQGTTVSGKTPAGAISLSTGFGSGTAAATSSGRTPAAASTAESAFGRSVAGAVGSGPSATATSGY